MYQQKEENFFTTKFIILVVPSVLSLTLHEEELTAITSFAYLSIAITIV